MLTDAELERYARHIVLREVGGTGQARLRTARVSVIGAGGIGCPALTYLVAAGVGHIDLFDDDVVTLSNLQRQPLFTEADVGRPKVEVAREALARQNPGVAITTWPRRLGQDNADAALSACDVVLDGTDSFASRLVIADAALALRRPLISAAVGPFEGQLAVYRGWERGKPCYRCLVGAPDDRGGEDCATQGVLGVVPGVIGSLAALEVLRSILGFGDDPAGKLLIFDALALRFRTLVVPKDPSCRCAA